MRASSRIALALAGAGAIGAAWLALTSDSELGTARRWTSSTQCRACHAEVYAEWQGSHHQVSFTNPEVKKLSDDFRNKECQACHLPRPVFEVGLGKRTLPRLTRPDEGVDCLTCHLGADGAILGRHPAPAAGCEPRAEPAFQGLELCASCHNQHQTTDQFRASSHAAGGGHCNDCHMPLATRGGTVGRGRSHVFPGAHDEAMLARAATFEVARDGSELLLTVTNTGAAHNFPTEERHRAVDVVLRFVQHDGSATEWSRLHRFRQPYRDEPGENTQLPAGAAIALRARIPEGAVRAQARLWYRLHPFATDDQPASTLLYERELELR
jgi:hypothetical protein